MYSISNLITKLTYKIGSVFMAIILVMGDRVPLSLISNTDDVLRDDVQACNKSIQDAIERGKHALIPMLAEWRDSQF